MGRSGSMAEIRTLAGSEPSGMKTTEHRQPTVS
jgi:hypothetical protein